MDRSTGRVVVVVPFSGCAAPSLHPCWRCRVGERGAAIEEGEGEGERSRGGERRRRWEGGSTASRELSISGLWRTEASGDASHQVALQKKKVSK